MATSSPLSFMKRSAIWLLVMGCLSLTLSVASADEPRLFEQRIYTAHEGKLDALNQRFREHTCRLFEKHGMELIGFWVPTDPERSKDTLIYILAYPSQEARDASWKAFIDDPEWKAAYEASHADGPLVKGVESVFMTGTDYSAIK